MLFLANTSGSIRDISDIGITLAIDEIRDISIYGLDRLRSSNTLVQLLGSGTIQLTQDNTADPIVYSSPSDAIGLVLGYSPSIQNVAIPGIQKANENTIYTHNTYRPIVTGKSFLATWAGSDDDIENNITGGGSGWNIQTAVDTPVSSHDVVFTAARGDVYIQSAYIGCEGASFGDCISATLFGKATTMINTPGPYNITNNKVTYVGGTNGSYILGGVPNLIPAFGSGSWDFNGTSLVPNLSNTGAYNIYNIEKQAYKILNNFQLCGTLSNPLLVEGTDTYIIKPGYFIRVSAINNSNTAWKMWFNIKLFREQT